MNEKELRTYIIRKFGATVAVVTAAEFVLVYLINNILFPVMADNYFPVLSEMRLVSVGSIIVAAIFGILYLTGTLIGNLVPSFGSVINSLAVSAFASYGIEFSGMTISSAVIFVITIIVIVVLILLPLSVGAWVFSRLVTKRINVYEKAREDEQREEQRKRYLMISDIAHDLKTPMTTVTGYAKALQDGMVRDEDKKEYLDAISEKTMRMNDIVQMLFDYVRLGSEGFALNRVKTDICELVRGCAAEAYRDIEDSGDELEVDIPDDVVMMDVDKIQLSRVINNLFTNAVKHNPRGTKILVRVKIEPDEVRVFVADSGDLIPESVEANMFEPFVMGDESRSSGGGSGLGLSVASKIINLHGFRIKYVKTPEIKRYNLDDIYRKVFVIIMSRI